MSKPLKVPGVLFRADGGARIGHGHVMRSLALCQEFRKRGVRTAFVSAVSDPEISRSLRRRGIPLFRIQASPGSRTDARRTQAIAGRLRCAAVVLDGYSFGRPYRARLRQSGLRICVISDGLKNDADFTDILVKHGPRCALIRTEFDPWARRRRQYPARARRVLIMMGGTDVTRLSLKVLKALEESPVYPLEIIVLLGASNPAYVRQIRSFIHPSRHSIRLVQACSDVGKWMHWADMAVTAAGSSSWEKAYLGLPSAVFSVVDNQRRIAKQLAANRLAWHLGDGKRFDHKKVGKALAAMLLNAARRKAMSAQLRQTVDGQGRKRIADEILSGMLSYENRRVCK